MQNSPISRICSLSIGLKAQHQIEDTATHLLSNEIPRLFSPFLEAIHRQGVERANTTPRKLQAVWETYNEVKLIAALNLQLIEDRETSFCQRLCDSK